MLRRFIKVSLSLFGISIVLSIVVAALLSVLPMVN